MRIGEKWKSLIVSFSLCRNIIMIKNSVIMLRPCASDAGLIHWEGTWLSTEGHTRSQLHELFGRFHMLPLDFVNLRCRKESIVRYQCGRQATF